MQTTEMIFASDWTNDMDYKDYEEFLLKAKPSPGAVISLAFHWMKKSIPSEAEPMIKVFIDHKYQRVEFAVMINGTSTVSRVTATGEAIHNDFHLVAADVAYAAEMLFMGQAYKSYLDAVPPPKHESTAMIHPVAEQLQEVFPVLEITVHCPVKDCTVETELRNLIPHLNDVRANAAFSACHGWSREEIADWLETTDLDIGVKT